MKKPESIFSSLRERIKWLDPFTYVDLLLEKINPDKNPFIEWPVQLISAFLFAWIAYLLLGWIFGTATPFVIILSPSMEPVLYRGDVVLLAGASAQNIQVQTIKLNSALQGKAFWDFAKLGYYQFPEGRIEATTVFFSESQVYTLNKQGDVLVYFSQFRQEPIIHRAVLRIEATDGNFFLTKGDSIHNNTIDQDCGRVINGTPERACITLYPVQEKEIQGKMLLKIPLLGYLKLLIFDDIPILLFGCPQGRTCYLP